MLDTEIFRYEREFLDNFYEVQLQKSIGDVISETQISNFLLWCHKTAKIYNPNSGETISFKSSLGRNYVMLKHKKAIAIDGTRLEIIFE